MVTLYMTKGLPASGKTTWAKEMQAGNPNIVRGFQVNYGDF